MTGDLAVGTVGGVAVHEEAEGWAPIRRLRLPTARNQVNFPFDRLEILNLIPILRKSCP